MATVHNKIANNGKNSIVIITVYAVNGTKIAQILKTKQRIVHNKATIVAELMIRTHQQCYPQPIISEYTGQQKPHLIGSKKSVCLYIAAS